MTLWMRTGPRKCCACVHVIDPYHYDVIDALIEEHASKCACLCFHVNFKHESTIST